LLEQPSKLVEQAIVVRIGIWILHSDSRRRGDVRNDLTSREYPRGAGISRSVLGRSPPLGFAWVVDRGGVNSSAARKIVVMN
jgi:hypothetical protein